MEIPETAFQPPPEVEALLRRELRRAGWAMGLLSLPSLVIGLAVGTYVSPAPMWISGIVIAGIVVLMVMVQAISWPKQLAITAKGLPIPSNEAADGLLGLFKQKAAMEPLAGGVWFRPRWIGGHAAWFIDNDAGCMMVTSKIGAKRFPPQILKRAKTK